MVDTFSGIGGFSLAAEWTGRIKPVQFIEIDPWCRRVLAKHWPGVPIHDDIKTFLADPMRAGGRQECGSPLGDEGADERWAAQHDYLFGRGSEGRARLDLITGGFPCQPFSQAGKQGGANDDRYLWPELARVVAALRPRWCLFENVNGIVNMAGGLERVWADLEADGYEVGAVVIPAAAVGAAHKRDRVWIVAHDVSESDAIGRGRWQDDEGQAPTERDGHSQAGDVAHTQRDGHRGEVVGGQTGGAHTVGPTGGPSRPSSGAAGHEALSGLGQSAHGLSRLVDGRFAFRPFGPDWEDGIPRVTTSEVDRVSKLKALGNSIVPQVAYELMLMLLAVDDQQRLDDAGGQ